MKQEPSCCVSVFTAGKIWTCIQFKVNLLSFWPIVAQWSNALMSSANFVLCAIPVHARGCTCTCTSKQVRQSTFLLIAEGMCRVYKEKNENSQIKKYDHVRWAELTLCFQPLLNKYKNSCGPKKFKELWSRRGSWLQIAFSCRLCFTLNSLLSVAQHTIEWQDYDAHTGFVWPLVLGIW